MTSKGAEGVVYEVAPPSYLETMFGDLSRCSVLSKCEPRERRERASQVRVDKTPPNSYLHRLCAVA